MDLINMLRISNANCVFSVTQWSLLCWILDLLLLTLIQFGSSTVKVGFSPLTYHSGGISLVGVLV